MEEFIELPEAQESKDAEIYIYDSTAKPYRTTYVYYKIGDDRNTDISKNKDPEDL